MNHTITSKTGSVAEATGAIQQAIDDCSRSGGGRVTVPAGVFTIGTISLRSHVELHLEHGALLKASGNLDDYNTDNAFPQNSFLPAEEWNGSHLILALETENVSITGFGVIDGSGELFYAPPKPPDPNWFIWRNGLALAKDKKRLRPGQMVYFCECKNVLVENVTMRNSTSWTLFLHGCDNVSVRGIRIFNPPYAANTDGIDIDTSRFVTVSDCIIDTGDDAITLRGDRNRLKDQNRVCEFVTITNCVLASSSSVFRIGIGQVPIRHARIANIVISRGGVGIDLMSSWGVFGTEVSDIRFSGISAVNIAHPIYCRGVSKDTPESVHDITVENYYAECFADLWIAGSPSCRPHAIRLRNLELHVKPNPGMSSDGKSYPESLISIDKADDILLESVCVFWECGSFRKWKQVLKTNDSTEIVSRNCRLPEPEQ